MEAFYLYILQVNIGILAFYLLYRFLLVHDTFLEMRRAYWWLVWATVFAYPWVELHAVRGEAMPLQVVMADYVETITLVASAVAPVEAPSWTWQDALAGVWALGAAVLVVRFLVQLAVVCRLAWRGRKLVWHGQRVIALDSGEQPFSFFGWIFVNPEHARTWNFLPTVPSCAQVSTAKATSTTCSASPTVWVSNKLSTVSMSHF